MLAEFLDKGKQPDAGCLPDVGVLAGYILGQDGVEDPGNHIIVFYICQERKKWKLKPLWIKHSVFT